MDKYRSEAHERCKLILRKTYKVPVFFHILRGYDSNLIVRRLRSFPCLYIMLIGQGLDKYLTLGWGEHLVFKDSLQFLANSSDTLCSNLFMSGKDPFKQLAASSISMNPHTHTSTCFSGRAFTPTSTSTNGRR